MKSLLASILSGFSQVLKVNISLSTFIRQQLEFISQVSLRFRPRESDIFLVTYPRSGTTWSQMILHLLSSDGNMDFAHISSVIPYFERSLIFNTISLDEIDKMPSPRIFKSHLAFKHMPKGPHKIIYIARDGMDVAVSYFHFYRSHLGYKGDFDSFFKKFLAGDVLYNSWFDHVNSWSKQKGQSNILFIHYEDLLKDKKTCIQKMADFCGFELSDEKLQQVMVESDFENMKKHSSKFDPVTEKLLDEGYLVDSFFRQGTTGEGKTQLSENQKTLFIQKQKALS